MYARWASASESEEEEEEEEEDDEEEHEIGVETDAGTRRCEDDDDADDFDGKSSACLVDAANVVRDDARSGRIDDGATPAAGCKMRLVDDIEVEQVDS